MRWVRTGVLICFLLPVMAASAFAAKRLALVIGNNDYREVPKLEKAVGDATAIGEKLAKLGFQVNTAFNMDRRNLNQALSKLYGQIEPGDTVLVQYSGHGVEIEGQNYLLPVDIPLPTDGGTELLKSEALPLNTVVSTLEAKGAGARILIIDACRDNPFAASGTRGMGGTRGLANVATSKGTFIMYSAGAGQAALDRLGDADNTPTSVYTRVLLSRLDQPTMKLRDLAASIRDDVEQLGKSVGHEQRPAYYDDLPENFSLVTNGQAPAVTPPAVTQPQTTEPAGLNEERAYKLAEKINTVAGWDVFLEQYPDGTFTPYAEASRQKLIKASAPKPKPAPAPPEEPQVQEPAAAATCGQYGEVSGLDPNGDNFLAVRNGPGSNYIEIDRLYGGKSVAICNQIGKWLMVQYDNTEGWVFSKYIAR